MKTRKPDSQSRARTCSLMQMCAYDASADSSAEFPDRASMMEVRLQAQEDEITLLKSSLADALRRIRIHDQVLGARKGPNLGVIS
uniref:Uncharacterized protein n=1 Tax=Amphilophus citrinellus TaxID=61819 RepID=A0A3Q0S7K7_AMPCI